MTVSIHKLNLHVNNSVGGNNENFSSRRALSLCAWFDIGCRIAQWPKMMLGAELPCAAMCFS